VVSLGGGGRTATGFGADPAGRRLIRSRNAEVG
jgi:hypothetical protein